MRLFVAVLLEDQALCHLSGAIQALSKASTQGNFTRLENLHLTLAFLGETRNISGACRAIDTVRAPACSLCLNQLGKFSRRGGDLYWIGTKRNDALLLLQRHLVEALQKEGFALDEREFHPHLTLGREVLLRRDFRQQEWETAFLPIPSKVHKISLMKSERICGRLVYTEIYAKRLEEC